MGQWGRAGIEVLGGRRERLRDVRDKFARELSAGGRRIRTIGPAVIETPWSGTALSHRLLARQSVLNDPIQLIGPASAFGNSLETLS